MFKHYWLNEALKSTTAAQRGEASAYYDAYLIRLQ